MKFLRNIILSLSTIAFMTGFSGTVSSAEAAWKPKKKITIVTHSRAGASTELFLRKVVSIWKKHKLVPVKAKIKIMRGKKGSKARRFVVKKNKGNAHMLYGYTPSQVNNPILMKSKIRVHSFTPVALMAVTPMVFIVHGDAPYKSMKDVLKAAKKMPNKIKHAGGPFGNTSSLTGVTMAEEAGVKISYVPFKSGVEAILSILGKHTDFGMEAPEQVTQFIKAGKIRILASSVPLASYPKVPTFESLGYKFEVQEKFRAIVGPPKMPKKAVAYFIKVLGKTRQTPEWKKYVRQNSMAQRFITGKEFGNWLASKEKSFAALAKRLNLKLKKKKKKKKKNKSS